jgi:hypothetical protein
VYQLMKEDLPAEWLPTIITLCVRHGVRSACGCGYGDVLGWFDVLLPAGCGRSAGLQVLQAMRQLCAGVCSCRHAQAAPSRSGSWRAAQRNATPDLPARLPDLLGQAYVISNRLEARCAPCGRRAAAPYIQLLDLLQDTL